MRILVFFDFTDEQIEELVQLVRRHGDHEVVLARETEEAVNLSPSAEVLLGHFPESVVTAAPRLRWIQSISAGMDGFLHPAVVQREEVVVTNVAGLYAPQGGEHAWALLLALTGMQADIAKGHLSFSPVDKVLSRAEPFQSFWSNGLAWGVYSQSWDAETESWQQAIEVLGGDPAGLPQNER